VTETFNITDSATVVRNAITCYAFAGAPFYAFHLLALNVTSARWRF
jgi:hypothetical protein